MEVLVEGNYEGSKLAADSKGIAIIVDWTFLLSYANLDTSIFIQFFNLGGQIVVYSLYIIFLDLNEKERMYKAMKRTIWLRRYGIVSLTVFIIGSQIGNGIYWILEQMMGPALDLTGSPKLAWNPFQIYLLFVLVLLAWHIILLFWEKIGYILSLEWILNKSSKILNLKRSSSLYISERLYPHEIKENSKNFE